MRGKYANLLSIWQENTKNAAYPIQKNPKYTQIRMQIDIRSP